MSGYGIGIDQKDHIIKNIIQGYWGTKTKEYIKIHKSPFPKDKSSEKDIFMATSIIGE